MSGNQGGYGGQGAQGGYGGKLQYQDTLYQVCSFSFTSNNLLSASLMNRQPIQPDKDRKERYFCFFSLAPGEGGGGNRTYVLKRGISQKLGLRMVESIAFVLEQASKGNFAPLPFSSFTNSGPGFKQLYIVRFDPSKQQNQGQNKPQNENRKAGPGIIIGIKQGNGPAIQIHMSYAEAYAFSRQLDLLFQKGMELEMDFQMKNRPPQHEHGNYIQSQPEIIQDPQDESWGGQFDPNDVPI